DSHAEPRSSGFLVQPCELWWSVAERRGSVAQQQRAADQAEVAVRLRMVAQTAFGLRVVLLRQQPGRPSAVEHLLEQLLGVRAPSGAQVRLDHPRRTEVEAALAAGQPVVPLVPIDGRSAA